LTTSQNERNFGLIGRVLCAGFVAATLSLSPAEAAPPSGTVTDVTWHGSGVVTWQGLEHRTIAPQTIHRLTPGLAPGRSKVIASGAPGRREVRVEYSQRDGGPVHRRVLISSILRKPRPRIIAEGIGETPPSAFDANGVIRMAYIARSAIQMLATAYTASCAGCGGMTAIGRRAGHGIVAVDPRVIPLGTRLYIPGYGLAVAGDTGGDIVGRRIDLGFDSLRDAMLFGKRDVTVYRLK
jgi:3D (Asp-Asp-Asp) domain-containing protein